MKRGGELACCAWRVCSLELEKMRDCGSRGCSVIWGRRRKLQNHRPSPVHLATSSLHRESLNMQI